MPPGPGTPPGVFECDSCGWEVAGYTKKELLDTGWRWHDAAKGRMFVMCDGCGRHYEKRRAAA